MREAAQSALRQLDLDYAITSISGGAGQDCEIVMWDKPKNSYFSIRVPWESGRSHEQTIASLVQQLMERLADWRTVRPRRFGERKPRRHRGSQRMWGGSS